MTVRTNLVRPDDLTEKLRQHQTLMIQGTSSGKLQLYITSTLLEIERINFTNSFLTVISEAPSKEVTYTCIVDTIVGSLCF